VGDVAAARAVALGFGGYLGAMTGLPTVVAALMLVALAGLTIYVGIAQSVALANLLT
jgi:hypothetical protein